MSECFIWRPIDLDLIPQKLPFHLDFDLSGSEDGEAGTNLLSNYPKPTHQPDFDFQPVNPTIQFNYPKPTHQPDLQPDYPTIQSNYPTYQPTWLWLSACLSYKLSFFCLTQKLPTWPQKAD